jgi:hypothetical protein
MLLNELFEAETKHVTFCFGRMNPPTIGHKQVLDTMQSQGGEMKIFVSQSQDKKKNPLDYGTKIKFIKEMFPQYAKDVVDNAALNTIGKVASYLHEQGYNAVTFVAGSDRLEDMKHLLTQYNGVEGKAHGFYKFDVIDFASSGDREDGAEGVAGVSASGARAAAANNDFEGFQEATGAGELAKPLFAAVRKGMGINEGIEEAGFLSFLKSEPPKKKWDPAKDSRVISNKRNNDDAWIKLLVDKHRRGIELTDREWNSIQQWKLKKSMNSENVGEVEEDISRRGFLKGIGAAASIGAAGVAQAQISGEDTLPDIVAHVRFKVDGKEINKEINLGTTYKSPREAGAALDKFMKSKGIKYFDYDLERVKPKDNDYLDKTPYQVKEAPIEMDPADPMDPMIHSHDKANPAKLKYRMLRAAGQLKDLAARAENASPGEWQIMTRQFDELKMNMEQIRHALEELGKVRSKGGIRSRGITV